MPAQELAAPGPTTRRVHCRHRLCDFGFGRPRRPSVRPDDPAMKQVAQQPPAQQPPTQQPTAQQSTVAPAASGRASGNVAAARGEIRGSPAMCNAPAARSKRPLPRKRGSALPDNPVMKPVASASRAPARMRQRQRQRQLQPPAPTAAATPAASGHASGEVVAARGETHGAHVRCDIAVRRPSRIRTSSSAGAGHDPCRVVRAPRREPWGGKR